MKTITNQDLVRFKAAVSMLAQDASRATATNILRRFLGTERLDKIIGRWPDYKSEEQVRYIEWVLWEALYNEPGDPVLFEAQRYVNSDLLGEKV